MPSLATRLRELRFRARLTQEQLAHASGVAVRTIRNIERGEVESPRWESLDLIADALGVRHDDLRRVDSSHPAPPHVRRPAQLPAAAGDLTGRDPLVRRCVALLGGNAGGVPGAVPLLNLSGRPGVGKTTVAVALGHRLREAYPDGQLFVHLAGATAFPRPAHELVGELLISLGVQADSLPKRSEARTALLRSLTADRRLLLVVDDAATEVDVETLLPGPPSAVVVTSRRPLTCLPGVRTVDVDVLAQHDAVELLARIIGTERAAGANDDVVCVASACAGLPLALRIAGARLAARPEEPVATLVSALDDERRRLNELSFADLEVRSTLALACRALTEQQRTALALLGRLDVPTVSVWTAAALFGVEESSSRRILGSLVDARLVDAVEVDEFGETRYSLHDLLRLFARELPVSGTLWRDGLLALAGHWLAVAEAADAVLPVTSDIVAHASASRVVPARELLLRVRAAPLSWFRSEVAAAAAGVEQLAGEGLAQPAWNLAGCLRTFVVLQSDWDVWERTHRVALDACRSHGDMRGMASMQFGLGKLRIDLSALPEEEPTELLDARRLFASVGDLVGEARTLHELAHWCFVTGNPEAAEDYCDQAVTLAERTGDDEVLADVLYMAGRVRNGSSRFAAAQVFLDEALAVARRLRKPRNEAQVLWQLAAGASASGAWERARPLLEAAVVPLRAMGDRRGEICVVLDLAAADAALEDRDRAEDDLEHCLVLCDDIGEVPFRGKALVMLGRLRAANGNSEAAVRVLESARVVAQQLGDPIQLAEVDRLLSAVSMASSS